VLKVAATLMILIGLGVALMVYVGGLGPQAISSRDVIEVGLARVKESIDLSASQEATVRLQLAISDYTISTGGVPPTELALLVPKYFDQVPEDPNTGEPFEYLLDGMVPRLGAQVRNAGAAVQVASAKRQTEPDQGGEGEQEVSADEVLLQEIPVDTFVYSAEGKRDPFVQFDFSGDQAELAKLPPLQRFSLEQLRVTAILKDSKGEPVAIVEDSRGIGYPVRSGTKIGNAGGEVIEIQTDMIKILETRVDFTGKEIRHVEEMELNKKAEGGGGSGRRRRNSFCSRP